MKMKREDLVRELHDSGRMSMREAGKVMDAILKERERLFRNMDLEVRTSPIHGRGVFATADIQANAILEECHFIQLKETNFANLDPALKAYAFSLPRASKGDARTHAIALGVGSIINHSHDHPNAAWTTSKSRRLFIFTSLRDIRSGEEILMDYNRG